MPPADVALLHATQKQEEKEKADAWWMDDGTRTFLFKCMQLESSAVLTVDRDNHEHMTCRQARDVQCGLRTDKMLPEARRNGRTHLRCRVITSGDWPLFRQSDLQSHVALYSWQSCRQRVLGSTGGAT
jgi:hypothetical protein